MTNPTHEHKINPGNKRMVLVREWRPRGTPQKNWRVYMVCSSPRAAEEAVTHLRYGSAGRVVTRE